MFSLFRIYIQIIINFFVFIFKLQEYHSLIPQENYSKINTGTLDNCRDKILTKYRELVQDKTDRHKDNFFFEYPLRACCKFEGGMKQGLRLIMSRSSAISCKYIREDETAVVRGVRAWSSRMSLLFHVSLISLKLQEYHSLIPQENHSRINAPMRTRL